MYDVIILGSGPAGLTAAIYTTRANLKTLVIAGTVWGGQLMLTSLVENYPGFPDGIQGPDLMMAMRKQVEHHGAEIVDADFKEGDFSKQPFLVKAGEKSYESRSVIIATGADTKWLEVPGEKELRGKGVSSCATCDGAFFRGKNVIVVGGGDSALEEALFLTHFANTVNVVHRRDILRASKILQDRAKNNPKINFIYNTVVEEIIGLQRVERVKVRTNPSDKSLLTQPIEEIQKVTAPLLKPKVLAKEGESIVWEFPIDGVFVAIGHIPNSAVLKGIDVDEQGYVIPKDRTHTNVEGVFVAGDVHDSHYKQAVTAAGFGCMAALDTERWLSAQK